MDEKQFEEPKNDIGQSPLDQCMDSFWETLHDECEEPEFVPPEKSVTFASAVQAAIEMWEILKGN